MSMPGASSEMKDATEDTQRMCDQLKTKVEDMTKKTYEEFRAVKYRQQIVAGTNFFIKVHVGGESYLHLRVFQGLLGDGVAELVDVQEDRAKEDPIVYF
ncbi:hypothetical protein L3Q82_018132 [Scortum barcoo]|uniref:Uncharacterized protein n=1 Tax=Scortum barcoo TaxID=214431 RepID=A0ACB8VIQ6_9TELE|nr:hypothetical protein L3Q82_018132 [Scortum barcoo]